MLFIVEEIKFLLIFFLFFGFFLILGRLASYRFSMAVLKRKLNLLLVRK